MGYAAVKAVKALTSRAQENANAYAYQQAQKAYMQDYWRNYRENCSKDELYMGWF